MLKLAAVLFAVAAAGGLAMAYVHFAKNKNPPVALAVLHGVLGATALVILGWAVVGTGAAAPAVAWALVLFVVAALGGFFVASYHMRGQRLPSAAVVVHAVVAVVGFALLLYGVYAATLAA